MAPSVTLSLPEGRYDALIFDCDGTLVDSMPVHHRAWRAALAESGARFEFDWETFVSRAGMGLGDTVMALNEQFGESLDPERVVAAQLSHYAELMAEVEPIAAVVELARAHQGRVPMAVASGGEKHLVLHALGAAGLTSLFEHVVCRQDVARGKPHPDMFFRCAELLGVSAERCWVLEDGQAGIEAAKAAGMGWLLVDWSGRQLAISE